MLANAYPKSFPLSLEISAFIIKLYVPSSCVKSIGIYDVDVVFAFPAFVDLYVPLLSMKLYSSNSPVSEFS